MEVGPSTPPGSGRDPRITFRGIRRFEIVSGALGVALGIALWNAGWWHWIIIAVGLSSLSPWWGAGYLLRKAERDPTAFNVDPGRGGQRGRRATLIMVVGFPVLGAVFGYLLGGWAAAAFIGAMMGVSALLGRWLYIRISRP